MDTPDIWKETDLMLGQISLSFFLPSVFWTNTFLSSKAYVKTMIDASAVMDGVLERIKGKSFRSLFLKYSFREVIKKNREIL